MPITDLQVKEVWAKINGDTLFSNVWNKDDILSSVENSNVAVFKNELSYIKDEYLRMLVIVGLLFVPSYFFKIPASSTGKYHPKFASGDGGLLRHVKVACLFAMRMLNINTVPSINPDVVIASLILHDGFKHGIIEEKFTCDDHAAICADTLLKIWELVMPDCNSALNSRVSNCIRSHMGQWNKRKDGSVYAPVPQTGEEKLVHICDYLAATQTLGFNFDESNNIV